MQIIAKEKSMDDLLHEIRNGDKKSFEKLVKQYYDQLFQFAFQYLQNKEEAEELVQDFFVDFWLKRDQLTIKNLEAYCWVSIRNRSINALAKPHKKIRQVELEDSIAFDPTITVETQELQEKIQKAVSILPNKTREVFLLCREQGLTYQEVADKMGIGKETVKSHMKTALTKLREYLKIEGYLCVFLFFIL